MMNFSFYFISLLLISSCLSSCASSKDSTTTIFGQQKPNIQRPTCVVRPETSNEKLKSTLKKYCKQPGVDCSVIQPGSICFQPDTLIDHASVAVNQYYRFHGFKADFCDHDVGFLTYVSRDRFPCIY